MTGFACYRKLEYAFPDKEPPQWADQIDRWYQLDAYAFGIAEAYYKLKRAHETPPDLIFLASAAASNETDFQFAQSGAISPSKFVHTLPNIRGSTLCQLMQWKGPLLCLQRDPATQITALVEAIDFLSESTRKIWIWSVTSNYCAHWFSVQSEKNPPTPFVKGGKEQVFKIEKDSSKGSQEAASNDASFQSWLSEKSSVAFSLPGSYVMTRVNQIE